MKRSDVVAITKKVAARLAASKVGGGRLTKAQIEHFREAKRERDRHEEDKKRSGRSHKVA
jgi:hypothetical protein